MSQITPLPTPPSRSRPSSFSTEAYDFLAALPTFVSEANVVASEVSSNSIQVSLDADRTLEYRDAAFAATNFKGVWSELTGALIIPSSVLHNSKLWMLTENIADVTSVEPGVSSLWFDVTFPKVGFSGLWSGLSGSVTTPNLVLHNSLLWSLSEDLLDVTAHEPGVSSSWVEVQSRLGGKSAVYSADATLDLTALQCISTDTSGIVLTLPVFTVADEGRILIIYNEGDFAFHVYTSSGSRITFLSPSSALRILLVDSATQKLALSYMDLTPDSSLHMIIGTKNVLATTASTQSFCIRVSDDRGLVVNFDTAYLIDITSYLDSVTAGSPTSLGLGSPDYYSATLVDEHKVLVCYRDNTLTRARALIVTTDGDTIVSGPILTMVGENLYTTATTLSTDKALVCYRDVDSSNAMRAVVASVSGTTVTTGATFVIADTGDYNSLASLALSSSVAVVVYTSTANQGTLQLLGVSGTTITLLSGSTPTAFYTHGIVTAASMVLLDTDTVFLCYRTSTNNLRSCVFTVSGSTITVGYDSAQEVSGSGARAVKLSSTKVAFGGSSQIWIADITGMSLGYTLPSEQESATIHGLINGGSGSEIVQFVYQASPYYANVRKLFLGIL